MKKFIMFLTYFRVICGPIIFILSVLFDMYFISLILFSLAAFTDFFDGYLARKYNLESSLGKLLDPIADKMLLCAALLSLVLISQDIFIGFMSMIILLREFWVSALREYTALNNITHASSVSMLAKVKTALQFFAICSFYISFSYNLSLGNFISSFLLFLSMIVSIKTAMEYTYKVFSE